jgi:hypothetical protein
MKTTVRWLLFEYKGLELVILSKPFKTKELAEKARHKYPAACVGKSESTWFGYQSSSQNWSRAGGWIDEYPSKLFGLHGKK